MKNSTSINKIYIFLRKKFKDIFNFKYGFEIIEYGGSDKYILIFLNNSDIIELNLNNNDCLLFINISGKYNTIQKRIYNKIISELNTLSIKESDVNSFKSYKIDNFYKANKVIEKLDNIDFDILFSVNKYNL